MELRNPGEYIPIETSKLTGLEPSEESIIVASKKAAKRRNSSFFPSAFWARREKSAQALHNRTLPQQRFRRAAGHGWCLPALLRALPGHQGHHQDTAEVSATGLPGIEQACPDIPRVYYGAVALADALPSACVMLLKMFVG